MIPSPSPKNSAQRLSALRALMEKEKIAAFIQPHDDAFLGEQIPPSAERIAYISNFSGSAGLAVITAEQACVFSDGRYTEQLKTELFPEWRGKHIAHTPPQTWLKEQLKEGEKVGYDPRLMSLPSLRQWQKNGFEMKALDVNPIDSVWDDQPSPPVSDAVPHGWEFTGQKSLEKRQALGEFLKITGRDAFLAADASVIAWALNIRASDLPNVPIALGYALFHQDGRAEFFINPARFKGELEDDKLTLFEPEKLFERLTCLKHKNILITPEETPVWLQMQIEKAGAEAVEGWNPLPLLRSTKNEVEISGQRKAQQLDGAALSRFLFFVKHNHGGGLNEVELADILNCLRLEMDECDSLSFETISAAGANAALPHYHATKEKAAILQENQIYLVDSGGQYKFGTTDCTRTIWSGPDAAPAEIKEAFTRVLKGNIALSRAHFPKGTPGYRLDTLARAPLWEAGLDYDHGTGHGVGSYLSVHEGPQSISPAPRQVPIEPGMIISNEPGYYEIGAYGIRIENLILAVENGTGKNGQKYMKFETLTYVPIDRDLIEPDLLNKEEISWLNNYHAQTYQCLSPLLSGGTLAWLEKVCAPL